MSFFKRLLWGGSAASLAAATTITAQGAPPSDPAKDPNMIQVYDAYGREMYIAKETYRKTILPDVLKQEWQNPIGFTPPSFSLLRTALLLMSSMRRSKLQLIDANVERGAVTLGVGISAKQTSR